MTKLKIKTYDQTYELNIQEAVMSRKNTKELSLSFSSGYGRLSVFIDGGSNKRWFN